MGKIGLIDIELSKLLSEGKYLLPLRYYKKKNINNIREITSELIVSFCKSEGAGVKKVNDFLELLIDVYISKSKLYEFNYSIMEIDFWFAAKDFKRFREYCREISLEYVYEIHDEFLNVLHDVRGMNKKRVEKVIERYKSYEAIEDKITFELGIDPKEIIEKESDDPRKILASLKNIHNKERIKDVVYKRYALGETLEHIGEEYGLSRERIRQLQVSGVEEVCDFLKIRRFKEALKEEFEGRAYCRYKEFYSLFTEENAYYAKVIIHNYKDIYLFNELELIYFEDNSEVMRLVQSVIDRLPIKFVLYDYLDYLLMALEEVGLKDISLSGIEHILSINGYHIYGEFVSKEKVTTSEVLEIIFKNYQKEPLRFDEEGFKEVKRLARNYLNFDLDGNIRAFENRLRENENMLLVDKLTFQHIENASVEEDGVIFIGEALEEIFKDETVVNATQIFDKNKDYLMEKGIATKYKMYNLISTYFGDYYKVGRGNTLEIYKNEDVVAQNKEEILTHFIDKHLGMVNKELIIKELSWPSYKIEDTISKSKSILKLGEYITTLDYLGITEEEKKALRKILDELLKNGGYTTGLLVYDKVIKNYNLRNFVKRTSINRSEKIASVVKKLFVELRGHINFLYNETSPYKNIEEAICGQIVGTIEREKLKEYMWSLGYKDMMTSMTLNRIIESGRFYELSRETLVSSKSFSVGEDIKSGVINFIEEKMGDKEYLVLSNLSDLDNLPSIDYRWTPHLIKSIGCRCGYKSIDRIYNDVRGEKIIIARESGNIQSFEELLIYLLKNKYNGVMQEDKVYDFFAEQGVVKKHKDIMDKKIPYDLKVTGKVKIDEVGQVTLIK